MSNVALLTETIATGEWGAVACVVRASGEVPTTEFFEGEPAIVFARFLALFEHMAKGGVAQFPPKRFEKVEGGLFAFRHEINNRQYRLPCFQDGNRWIITHGFVKPGARNRKLGTWPPQQVNRAQGIMQEYFERKKLITSPKGWR